jgi:ferredoxin-fold anticodon binding domain-containing protein
MFLSNDSVIDNNLTLEEAEKLCRIYSAGSDSYTSFSIEKMRQSSKEKLRELRKEKLEKINKWEA